MDEFTLPKDDVCYETLEGYKRFMAREVDDFWRVTKYKKYVSEIGRWEKCCPGGQDFAAEARPESPDRPLPRSVFEIKPLALFDKSIPCAKEIYSEGFWGAAKGDSWLVHYNAKREPYWAKFFLQVATKLHDCCMQVQEETAAREAQSLPTCANELARVRSDFDQCRQEVQRSHGNDKIDKDEIARLTAQIAGERNEGKRNFQALLQQTAPRPGMDQLASFPGGEASPALVVLGLFALTAGLLLGLPGRSRRSQMVAGVRSGGIALSVFLLCVALLPDTSPPELLLALTAAVLAVSLRALARILLEHGRGGQAPPSP